MNKRYTYVRMKGPGLIKWTQKIHSYEEGAHRLDFGASYTFDLCPGKDFLTQEEFDDLGCGLREVDSKEFELLEEILEKEQAIDP